MKILIVNSYFYPNMIGGTEHSVMILAETLNRYGNDVAILTADGTEKFSIETLNGLKIYRLGILEKDKSRNKNIISTIKHIRFKFNELNNTAISIYLDKVFNDFSPEIVHTNNLFGLSTYIWKYFHIKKVPIIHTLRDYWLIDPKTELNKTSRLITLPYQLWNKKRSKLVDYVTAPSNFTLRTFLNYDYFNLKNSKVVPNCISLNLNNVKSIINKKYNNNESHIKFLFVGMLAEHKGIEELLKIFTQLDKMNISLTICGNGPLNSLVKQYDKKYANIVYLGQLSSHNLQIVYEKSDVLIVPSLWDEPFGRIVIEGNSNGLPVIVSNKGGLPEIVNQTRSGLIFNTSKLDDLKNKILVMSNRDTIKSYYQPILENIDFYSEINQMNLFLKIYNDLL